VINAFYVRSSTRVGPDYISENPENAFGEILSISGDKAIPVICMHGGSMWLCRSCADRIMEFQEAARAAGRVGE